MMLDLARTLGRVAGLLIGAYLGYVAIRGSRMLVWPEPRPLVPDPAGAPALPSDLGFDYEDVSFTTDDGVSLTGWLIPAAHDTKTAVVVLHGFTGNRLPELAGFVPWLQERHNVLQFDFRGHGESGPSPVTMGSRERRDVAAAVTFLRSRGLGPIALFGVSMGAAAAILAAPDLPVAAVVADAAYAQVRHPIANRMRQQGWPMAGAGSLAIVGAAAVRVGSRLPSPISAVGRISPRALLVIAPTGDQLISWRQSLALYEAAGQPKELFVVGGAGHGDAYATDPEGYRRRVLDFLERHLEAA
ncbi:MAG TPA: alpha/beta hydrolase [Candidatus Limnocylindria bacterium]